MPEPTKAAVAVPSKDPKKKEKDEKNGASSKKPAIRRPVSLLPSLSDSVNTNGVVERGDKMMAS